MLVTTLGAGPSGWKRLIEGAVVAAQARYRQKPLIFLSSIGDGLLQPREHVKGFRATGLPLLAIELSSVKKRERHLRNRFAMDMSWLLFHRPWLRPCVTILLVAIAYAMVVLFSVRSFAARIAGDQPYCIQVATSDGYRSLKSSLQLAGFFMSAPDGPMHHAVLVVGGGAAPQLYHWSYRNHGYMEGAYAPPLYCEPVPKFLEHLNDSEGTRKNVLRIRHKGYKFEVPEEYRPHVYWPSQSLIVLSTQAPNFRPRGQRLPSDIPSSWMEIWVQPELDAWQPPRASNSRVTPLADYHGLSAVKIEHASSRYHDVEYTGTSTASNNSIRILCMVSVPQCSYELRDGELIYRFSILADDVEHWREIERTLLSVIGGFIRERPSSDSMIH